MRGMRMGRAAALIGLALGLGVAGKSVPSVTVQPGVQQAPGGQRETGTPAQGGTIQQQYANLIGGKVAMLQQSAHGSPWPGRRAARARHSSIGGGRRP